MEEHKHSEPVGLLPRETIDAATARQRLRRLAREIEPDDDNGVGFYRGLIPASLLSIVLWAIIAGIAYELWTFVRTVLNFIS